MNVITQQNFNQILTKKAYTNLAEYFKSIQKAYKNGFFFYQTGVFKPDEVVDGLRKFDQDYQIFEHKIDKTKNYNSNKASVCIKLFIDEDSNIFYVLMARQGCDGAMNNLFFEQKDVVDARLTENCLTIYGYNIRSRETIAAHFGKNEWEINVSENYQELLDIEFMTALKNQNWKQIKRSCKTICSLFHSYGVSIDYRNIRFRWVNQFTEMVKSDSRFRGHTLHDIYKLPPNLPRQVHSKIKKIGLWSVLPVCQNNFN